MTSEEENKTKQKINRSFFDTDREYSQYKRLILRNMLGAIFPYYWRSKRANFQYENVDACFHYLDGFGGKGSYRDSPPQNVGEDVSLYGSPVIAVDRALESLNDVCKGCDDPKFDNMFRKKSYAVKFFFNEFELDNLNSLKQEVSRRFELYGWKLESREKKDEEEMVFYGQVPIKGEETREVKMKTKFFNRKFEDLDLSAIPSPLFSFVDPFGIKPIPMSSVRHLIGSDREIFLNLMVATINRRLGLPGTAVENLYGPLIDEHFEDHLAADLGSLEKLQYLADEYFAAVDREFLGKESESWPDGYFSVKFAFRKGKSDPNVGTIYYMGFGSCKLNFVQIAKQGMMKVTDEPFALNFSMFYRETKVEIPYERKTRDDQEADIIWEKFKGKKERLGLIKKRILLETPFVYHAKALKNLEDRLLIVDVDTVNEEKRSMGSFGAHVSLRVDDLDGEKPHQKYHNSWTISFCSEELKQSLTPLDKETFKRWLLEKVRAFSKPIKRDELKNKTPRVVRESLDLKVSTFNEILKEFRDQNLIRLIPPDGKINEQTIEAIS